MNRLHTMILLLVGLSWSACSSTAPSTTHHAANEHTISIEGWVIAAGNAPFSVLLLETPDRMYYVLDVDKEKDAALRRVLPGRYRVTGTLYLAEWNGQPHAHLRPTAMERVEE